MSYRTPFSDEFARLTTEIGVYALCDLDDVPIYVGRTESIDERGIQGRVRRHLTSARSDIVANLQLDVWEVAYVRAWIEPDKARSKTLERQVHHEYADTIITGKRYRPLLDATAFVEPTQTICVLVPKELARRRTPQFRFPRQLWHVQHLIDVILTRKDSLDMRRSLANHMQRLNLLYDDFEHGSPPEAEETSGQDA